MEFAREAKMIVYGTSQDVPIYHVLTNEKSPQKEQKILSTSIDCDILKLTPLAMYSPIFGLVLNRSFSRYNRSGLVLLDAPLLPRSPPITIGGRLRVNFAPPIPKLESLTIFSKIVFNRFL